MSNPANQNQHPTFDAADLELIGGLKDEDGLDTGASATDDPNSTAPAAEAPAPAPVAAAAPAPAPVPAPAAAAPAADTGNPDAAERPKGNTQAALRASRHAEKRSREEAEELRRLLSEKDALIADFKAGKAPVNHEITDDELAQLDEDFPLQAKIVRKQRELDRQLEARAPATAAVNSQEFVPAAYDPAVQELIDAQPDLLAWQYSEADQDKFARAVEYDTALKVDPDWKDKTAAERFDEAARRTKASLGLKATPAATPLIDPAAALAAAQLPSLGGISDFKGGATGSVPTQNFAKMSDEAIMGSLSSE